MVDDPTLWSIRQIDSAVDISDMNCGNEPWGQSVTDFLVSDALEQQKWLFSKTRLFYYDHDLIGYVTLAASVLELRQAHQMAKQPGISEIGRNLLPSVLIARFGVHQDHQRKGYGRKMFEKMFDWVLAEVILSSVGARLLILHVDKDNRGGRDFWKACGFRNGAGAKNILMWLDLYPFAAKT
jgi:GNAT superfamily N-acetyltransferase